MATVKENGEIVTVDGRIDCDDYNCKRQHEFVDEGTRYTWRVHKEKASCPLGQE